MSKYTLAILSFILYIFSIQAVLPSGASAANKNRILAAGYDYTAGVYPNGTVFCTSQQFNSITSCRDWNDVVSLSAGQYHILGLTSTGKVLSAGNTDGIYGVDSWSGITAVAAGGCDYSGAFFSAGLKADGHVVTGGNDKRISAAKSWTDITELAGGGFHLVGLKKDGSVVGAGFQDAYAGVNAWRSIIALSAGELHTVGLKADGTVAACGDNSYGQCNVGSWRNVAAISAGSRHTVGLKTDGTVAACGDNSDGQCNVGGWSDIIAVAAGDSHTVGLKADGSLVACGRNWSGQGYTAGITASAAFCGAYNNGYITRSGDIVITGQDTYGQASAQGWSGITQLSIGQGFVVGLKADGSVLGAGYNDAGQCSVSNWRNIIQLSAGYMHTVGLKSDNTVVGTGYGGFYSGTDTWSGIKQVSAGATFTAGLKGTGSVVLAGILPVSNHELASLNNVAQVAAGAGHLLALYGDGTVYAVGGNSSGQCDVFGWRYISAVAAGTRHSVGLRSDRTVVACGDNSYGQCNVSGWKDIVAIAAGGNSTVGIKSDGTVVSCGENIGGPCDIGSVNLFTSPGPCLLNAAIASSGINYSGILPASGGTCSMVADVTNRFYKPMSITTALSVSQNGKLILLKTQTDIIPPQYSKDITVNFTLPTPSPRTAVKAMFIKSLDNPQPLMPSVSWHYGKYGFTVDDAVISRAGRQYLSGLPEDGGQVAVKMKYTNMTGQEKNVAFSLSVSCGDRILFTKRSAALIGDRESFSVNLPASLPGAADTPGLKVRAFLWDTVSNRPLAPVYEWSR